MATSSATATQADIETRADPDLPAKCFMSADRPIRLPAGDGSANISDVNVAVQTTSSLSATTPRKIMLRRKLHTARRVAAGRSRRRLQALRQSLPSKKRPKHVHMQDVDDIVKAVSKYLSGNCLTLFEQQLRFSQVAPKGRRYSTDAKLLALSLHNYGPKAYRFLSEMLALPSRTTLSFWLQTLQVMPGFCQDVIQAIACKVRCLRPEDRVCVLMIDEMSLKRYLAYDRFNDLVVGYEDYGSGFDRKKLEVTSALVFMIRGLALNWKQPVGYVLSHSACSGEVVFELLCKCLDILFDIGLDVRVVLSDQGSNFMQMTRKLGVTPDTPYFTYSGRVYCYMFDPPHLLKSVRNNLFKHQIHYDDQKVAKWTDISDFYKTDQNQRFRLAPKLTKRHVELPAFSKMKVKLAAQVISRTVAAALETHSQIAGSSGSETAEFLMKFNDIFDCMNSSQLRDANKRKRAVSVADTCEQSSFLQNAVQWLSTIRVKNTSGKDVTSSVKCFSGWQLSIASLLLLKSTLLQQTNYFRFILTRRLNQDPLENFFAAIRQKGGSCDNPTPLDFMRLFKQLCCKQLVVASVSGNSEVDLSAVLATLRTEKQKINMEVGLNVKPDSGYTLFPTDLSSACLEENGLYYVCGYLLRKLLKWHNCVDCDMMLHDFEPPTDSLSVYLKQRSFSDISKGGLLSVSSCFYQYVMECERIFATVFESSGHEPKILRNVVARLSAVPAPVTCASFPKTNFYNFLFA